MKKRVTTRHLGNLLTTLKARFINELSGRNINDASIEIYANVLSTNYKTLQTEEIRISESFLTRNLPIPLNSALQIHISINDSNMDLFESYLNKITDGLEDKDFYVDTDKRHITFANLKVIHNLIPTK